MFFCSKAKKIYAIILFIFASTTSLFANFAFSHPTKTHHQNINIKNSPWNFHPVHSSLFEEKFSTDIFNNSLQIEETNNEKTNFFKTKINQKNFLTILKNYVISIIKQKNNEIKIEKLSGKIFYKFLKDNVVEVIVVWSISNKLSYPIYFDFFSIFVDF